MKLGERSGVGAQGGNLREGMRVDMIKIDCSHTRDFQGNNIVAHKPCPPC